MACVTQLDSNTARTPRDITATDFADAGLFSLVQK